MKQKINKNLKVFFASGIMSLAVFCGLAFLAPVKVFAAATCDQSLASTFNNDQGACEGAGFIYDNSALTCSCPAGTGGNGTGVAGTDCTSNPNICQTGTICNGTTCVQNNGTANPTTNPTTNPTPNSTGGVTCPSPLVASNGLCLPPSTCSAGICSSNSLSDLILKVIQLLLAFAGIIAVVFLVLGGFWYITSAGNEEQAEKGRKALVNAIIGLVVVILAYTIVAIVAATINGADKVLK